MNMVLGVSKANNIVTDELLNRTGHFRVDEIYESIKEEVEKYDTKENIIIYINQRARILSELDLIGRTDEYYYAK